jgi:hypothetical protein
MPFWGYWKPLELIQPPATIADGRRRETGQHLCESGKRVRDQSCDDDGSVYEAHEEQHSFHRFAGAGRFAAGHIPGAMNVSFDHLDKRLINFWRCRKKI